MAIRCAVCPSPDKICWCCLLPKYEPVLDDMIAQIKKEVAKKYKIKVTDLEGKSRKEEIVEARNEAIYRCRQETDANLTTIGRFFNRSHATVIHALKQNGNGKDLHRDIGCYRSDK